MKLGNGLRCEGAAERCRGKSLNSSEAQASSVLSFEGVQRNQGDAARPKGVVLDLGESSVFITENRTSLFGLLTLMLRKEYFDPLSVLLHLNNHYHNLCRYKQKTDL